jgi:hypothetical protein
MADDNTASTETAEVETPSGEATETANDSTKPAGDVPPEVKRALAKANKEAETLRLKLKEFEDRDKSEAEKLAERVDAAEKRAVEMEAAALRLEVAAEKGLSPAQAKRLVGTTRDELEADADELLTTFKPPEQPDESAAITTALDLGTRGTATVAGDPATDFAKFLKRELA